MSHVVGTVPAIVNWHPRYAARQHCDRVTIAIDMPTRDLHLDGRSLDLRATLWPFVRGPGDPTISLAPGAVWRATRTAEGPATVELRLSGGHLLVEAWGPGAEAALDDVPALVGLHDRPAPLPSGHPLVAALARRLPGLRIGRSGAVLEALVPAILEQKVTGTEARRAYRLLVERHGEVAPGPHGLRLPPDAATLAALPYYAFHPLGVEARRADTIRRAASRGAWLEELGRLPLPDSARRLAALPGVGAWTVAEVSSRAFGDPDAVSVGDFHLPNLVCWALAGEPRGDDQRMLELLEPYRGQRGRVIRLLEASGLRAPRFGPRLAPRSIARL
jgi:3-methyladenine DNA glycosylase/8-oxoguanine DNA glycosylase